MENNTNSGQKKNPMLAFFSEQLRVQAIASLLIQHLMSMKHSNLHAHQYSQMMKLQP